MRIAIINSFEEIVNGEKWTRCKIDEIKARNELYSEPISSSNIIYEKYSEYLNEIATKYSNIKWIVVALTTKLAEKHLGELMKMYYTHAHLKRTQ